jgi:hypothetical protein
LAPNVQTTAIVGITAHWNRDLYDGERPDGDPGEPSDGNIPGVSSHTALAARRVLRFVGWLAVSVFGLMGVAAALLAGLSAIDDVASDEAGLPLLAGAISACLLAAGAAILRGLRRDANVEGPGAPYPSWQR